MTEPGFAARDVFIHPTAVVDVPCEIGAGSKVWHFAHVCAHARIGPDCTLGQNVYVASSVVIGRGARLQNNVSLYDGVTLEDDVFCGPSMVFTNVRNPRAHVSRKHAFAPTLARRGATFGANCTIVCGVTVGRSAFVGAGAVVTRDVADFALVVGTPARVVGWMCACGERLPFAAIPRGRAACGSCGGAYRAVPAATGSASVVAEATAGRSALPLTRAVARASLPRPPRARDR